MTTATAPHLVAAEAPCIPERQAAAAAEAYLVHPAWLSLTGSSRPQSDHAVRTMVAAGYPAPRFDQALGSGMNGTAYATDDARMVCKLTWNGHETVGMLRADTVDLPGVCRLYGVTPCGLGYGMGLWALWREAFPAMGAREIRQAGGPTAASLDDLERVCNALRSEITNDTPRAEAVGVAMVAAGVVRRLSSGSEFERLATSLVRGVEQGLLLSDWKSDNIACRADGTLVLADPMVIPLPWRAGRQVPQTRLIDAARCGATHDNRATEPVRYRERHVAAGRGPH